MPINQLQTGVVYMGSDFLPIHRGSLGYVSGGMVVPDGSEWVKVVCADGNFAFRKTDDIKKAKDVNGKNHYIHLSFSHYVEAFDDSSKRHYFLNEEAAKAFEFEFSINLNRYFDKKSSRFFGTDNMLGYHDSRCRSIDNRIPSYVNDDDEYIVGVEVEKVDANLQRKGLAFEILHNTGWKKETDGSLNMGGYELVSPKLPLLDLARIEKACLPVKEYIDGNSDSSCGGHFNISRKGKSAEELLKEMKGFAPIIYSLYENRLTNRFCEAKQWKYYFGRYNTKYSAFYTKGNNVVEIRLFSRIPNYTTMMWRIKLMQVLLADSGNNLNQYLLKMSSRESKLYKLLREQFSHEKIKDKIKLAATLSERYGCGKVSNSIRSKINDRFGETVLPLL